MQKREEDGLSWIEFDLLADIPTLTHASFFRNGGYSQGLFHSLNTSYEIGDNEQHVTQNLQLIQKFFQKGSLSPIKMISGKQVHRTKIEAVDLRSPQEIVDCDALITAVPGLILLTHHADCQAAIIYDTKNHVIANVHSGWRGSVQNIYAKTIQKMCQVFGSHPQELLVCISPSLGPDDSEFIHFNEELPEEFWSFQSKPTYFDFWAISENQLQQAGILPHHIEIAQISTFSNPHDFFSYRREGVTGRHATCISLCK